MKLIQCNKCGKPVPYEKTWEYREVSISRRFWPIRYCLCLECARKLTKWMNDKDAKVEDD